MKRKRNTKDMISDQTSNINNFHTLSDVVFDVSRLCIWSVAIHNGPGIACYCWFDTEYPWRESHQCCEVREGKRAEQRLGGGADKYLLTALPTYYFLLFQEEVVTENKNGFARSMKI